MPEVSVVIPTRNRWNRLRGTLGGVLAQRDVDLEVLVVDDDSDQPPPSDLALDDPRVRLLRNRARSGIARTRNRGIGAATSDWIAFLDDDDLWAPTKLARQLQVAGTARADLVYSSAVLVDSRLEVVRVFPAPSPGELVQRITVQNVMPAGQSNVLVRRKLVQALGGFDEQLWMLADWELWIRLASTAKLARCQDIHVAYVLHEENMIVTEGDSARDFERVADLHIHDPAVRRKALLIGARWRAYNHRRAGRRALAAREYLGAAVRYRAPGMAVRIGAVVLGERVMSAHRPGSREANIPWIDAYRESLAQR